MTLAMLGDLAAKNTNLLFKGHVKFKCNIRKPIYKRINKILISYAM